MSDINLYTGSEQFRLQIGASTYQIREPEGWDEFMYVTKRDKNKHGFISSFTNDDIMLKFSTESGKEYIDAEIALNGPDANILLRYGYWDGVTFDEQLVFRLTLREFESYQNYSECGAGITENVELLLTRFDTKADVNGNKDFEDNTIDNLEDQEFIFHSKVLQKQSRVTKSLDETVISTGYSAAGNYINVIDDTTVLNLFFNWYGVLGLDFLEPSELTEMYYGSAAISPDNSFIKQIINYKAKERGDHTIDINVTLDASLSYSRIVQVNTSDSYSFNKSDCLLKIEIILRIGNDEEVLDSVSSTDCNEVSVSFSAYNLAVTRNAFIDQNEEVQLYLKYTYQQTLDTFVNVKSISTNLDVNQKTYEASYLNILALTETKYTTGGAIMIHEAFSKVCEIITGLVYPMKSDFLGREEIGYLATGCAGKYALTNGKKIRALPAADSHLKFSGNEFFNSLDAIFCCGLGLELSDGKFYFVGTFVDNKLTTTFYIPEHRFSILQFYNLADELLGTVDEVNIFSGTGTNDDPYVYEWIGTVPSLPDPNQYYVIVSGLVGTQIVRFEKREYFYRDIEMFSIPPININKKSYRESVNTDLIYNEMVIGYKKYPTDELNTLDEFNTKAEFLLPFKTIKNKLEKLSDFIASGYAIEKQRRAQFENEENGKSSIEYDDDVFIVALTEDQYESPVLQIKDHEILLSQKLINPPTPPFSIQIKAGIGGTTINAGTYTVSAISDWGFIPKKSKLTIVETLAVEFPILTSVLYSGGNYTPERTQPFDTVDGIIGPNSSYNLRISPKRMFLNWGKWINSGLFHKANTEVVINTFTKNNIILGGLETQFKTTETCNLGDDTKALIVENSNEVLSDINSNTKLLKPIKISFAARMDWVDVQYIRDRLKKGYLENAYGYITFYDLENNIRHGYIDEIKFNPKIEEVEFTLIEKA